MASKAVETHWRYVGQADELVDAWAFVMDHLDKVGSDPYIEIKPKWSSRNDFQVRVFHVEVAGMILNPEESTTK